MRISDWSSDVCSSDLRYVYEAAEAGDAKGLQAAMPEKAVALLHSPRAARRLAKLIALPERQRLQVAAISAAVFNAAGEGWGPGRSEEHTSELQSLMRISYAVFCLKKKKNTSETKRQI